MALIVESTIYNLQNAPDPVQQYYFLDFDQDADPAVFPADAGTVVYWAQDEFSFDITFTVIEDDPESANTEPYEVISCSYLNTYDFFSGTVLSADTLRIAAIENPFEEHYNIVQTYGSDSSGSIDTRFNEQASTHEAETRLDEGYLNVDTFAYIPPEDEVFKPQVNRYELQELTNIIDEDGPQSKFLGVSEWELPDERFLALTHQFTVTARGTISNNQITFPYSVYHESHWNFERARIFAERLQNELADLNGNDTDQTLEDAQNVQPDIPDYALDSDFVVEYSDIETITTQDANTQPLEAFPEEPPDPDANTTPEPITSISDAKLPEYPSVTWPTDPNFVQDLEDPNNK